MVLDSGEEVHTQQDQGGADDQHGTAGGDGGLHEVQVQGNAQEDDTHCQKSQGKHLLGFCVVVHEEGSPFL